jgi:hypothetical protein
LDTIWRWIAGLPDIIPCDGALGDFVSRVDTGALPPSYPLDAMAIMKVSDDTHKGPLSLVALEGGWERIRPYDD